MNKKILTGAVATALSLTSFGALALNNTSVLSFTTGTSTVTSCGFGTLVGQTCFTGGSLSIPTGTEVTDMAGSYFAMDTVVTDAIFQPNEKNSMTDLGAGVALGGLIGFVDVPWVFGGPLGQHYVTGTTGGTGLQALTNTTINMQGWTVFYNGGDIDMGSGVSSADARAVSNGGTLPDGNTANLTCSDANLCGAGATYVLDYTAVVPTGGFATIAYTLHLEGALTEVAAVPVPAAVWLFGSGLLGLVGVARRKAHA